MGKKEPHILLTLKVRDENHSLTEQRFALALEGVRILGERLLDASSDTGVRALGEQLLDIYAETQRAENGCSQL